MPEKWLLCTFLLIATTNCAVESTPTVSQMRSLVWGPGLDANIVLPARYFYIQAVAEDNVNFTSSPGENLFTVNIYSPGEQFTRIWVQVLDRKDGSFLVRYRMYSSYRGLTIEVKFQDEHVAQSPYVLKGYVYHETCDCPHEDGTMWYKDMQCPQSFPQIQQDLAHFPFVDPDRISIEIAKRFGQRQSLCHYTIKDNKVYVKTFGEHVGFRIFMDSILLSLTRKVKIQDIEFFVNLGDWPLEKRKTAEKLHPIFSWCGSDNTKDIVMPTYDITDSVLETMGRIYGPIVKHVSFFDFFQVAIKTTPNETLKVRRKNFAHSTNYKYQINIDGTVAAYRMPYLLAGGGAILKQDSVYYEHFYNDLRPWQHYIPFKNDLSDLLDKIQWAKSHDEEAKMIAKAGQDYARNKLMADHIFCYYFKLFQEYADLQVGEPKIRDGMELVEQPKDDLFPCVCHRTKTKDEL
ncbi:protein O-glucosyltransferase 2 isoform X4 [Scyliorhinus canicula]|uniref:protein O-glucosyltransferase 2 isoform X4 n=1 Tax=Scyliorhinus canicula TaxID=7830 RepID=UPI0018F5B4AE|nr:protein O-glucosyltransferase 2 isoform X4 [Scyliorhinus canicula]